MKKINGWLRHLVWIAALLTGTWMISAGAAAAVSAGMAASSANGTRVSSPELTKSKKKKNKNNNNSSSNNNGSSNNSGSSKSGTGEITVEEDGTYTSKEEVALYLHLYEHLPDNYITKKEAKKLGWVSSEGNLDEVAPGKSIGGDYFGNYEEILPVIDGVDYHECDIDFDGRYRNSKRIIYSTDGYIYYTEDHYETFEQLYPEE